MPGLTVSIRSAIAALLALIMLSGPAYAGTRDWKISESSGRVVVESGGTSKSAARGASLKAGDAVSTSSNSRAVIVRGGEYVVISPNSRVRITKPEESGAITQIFQYVGSALFKIEKKETPHFGVKTPFLAAVVKGTTFNVTVTKAGATVQVTEGRVEVSTLDGGAGDLIVPGRIARVDANDRQLLKVMGADEKSIRSPLPVSSEEQANDQAVSPTATEFEEAGDYLASDATIAESSGQDADSFGEFGQSDRSDSFSGRIGTPVASDPVNIAALTEGLISGNRGLDRPVGAAGGNADNPGNGNGNGNGGGNADNPGNGNGNGNADDPGNGNGNGNGNGRGDDDGDDGDD